MHIFFTVVLLAFMCFKLFFAMLCLLLIGINVFRLDMPHEVDYNASYLLLTYFSLSLSLCKREMGGWGSNPRHLLKLITKQITSVLTTVCCCPAFESNSTKS